MTQPKIQECDYPTIAERFRSGEVLDSIANDFDVTRSTILRVIHKLGLERQARAQKTILEKVDSMKPLDAVDFLLNLLDDFMVDENGPEYLGFRDLGFSPSESRMLVELWNRNGTCVDRRFLRAVSNPSRDEEVLADKIVDVHICRIRKMISELGLPVKIKSTHGTGYTLISDEGFLWPWECAP